MIEVKKKIFFSKLSHTQHTHKMHQSDLQELKIELVHFLGMLSVWQPKISMLEIFTVAVNGNSMGRNLFGNSDRHVDLDEPIEVQ